MSNSPTYKSWAKMKERCCNPNYPERDYYSGRCITLCSRWKSFVNFLNDMGERPSDAYSIERIDNSKGYSPQNCRWATRLEQGRNKRNNVILEANGKSQTLSDWSRELQVKIGTLWKRIKMGWDDSRIINTPIRNFSYHKQH